MPIFFRKTAFSHILWTFHPFFYRVLEYCQQKFRISFVMFSRKHVLPDNSNFIPNCFYGGSDKIFYVMLSQLWFTFGKPLQVTACWAILLLCSVWAHSKLTVQLVVRKCFLLVCLQIVWFPNKLRRLTFFLFYHGMSFRTERFWTE